MESRINNITRSKIEIPGKFREETKITESGSLDMNKMWNNVKERIIAAGGK
jgi:hypothetical protein